MTTTEPLRVDDIDEAILATVAYSDVFDMPIELDRLHRFLLGVVATRDEVETGAARLAESGIIGLAGDLAYLPGREEVLAIHAERVARAETMWSQAISWGRALGSLPFVRAVAVTGGLACDSVADHDDIDYLIVTEPGRLWTARLCTVVLVHVGRRFDVDVCPNYLVAEDALPLDERTSYSARELAQMVDITGSDTLTRMREENRWFLDHLPNASIDGVADRRTAPRLRWLQRGIESVVRTKPFDRLETWEMRRKIERLKEVASRRAEVAKPDESSFSPSVCKGHMVGNAAGIEVAWRRRIADSGAA